MFVVAKIFQLFRSLEKRYYHTKRSSILIYLNTGLKRERLGLPLHTLGPRADTMVPRVVRQG